MPRTLPKHRAREYETVFIVNPDIHADAMDQVATRLTDVIVRLDGKVLRAENWGKRRLAYPVKKHAKGTYVYIRYLGYSDMVHELERNMRMMEPVLKYITVKVAEDVDPDARPVNEEDISFIPMFDDEPEVRDTGTKPETDKEPQLGPDDDPSAWVDGVEASAKPDDSADDQVSAGIGEDEPPAQSEAPEKEAEPAEAETPEEAPEEAPKPEEAEAPAPSPTPDASEAPAEEKPPVEIKEPIVVEAPEGQIESPKTEAPADAPEEQVSDADKAEE